VAKVNRQVLKEMLEKEGKSQHDCALFFGVSDAAISKQVQRIKLMELPKSVTDLPPKKQRFVLMKWANPEMSGQEAAQQSHQCKNSDSAKAIASRLMSEPSVGVAMRDLFAMAGWPLEKRIERVGDLIKCADLNIAEKGLSLSFKLDGSFATAQVEAPTDYRRIAAEVTQNIIAVTQTIRDFERAAERAAERAQAIDVESTSEQAEVKT
jgi:CheY-like chemotaxis protein